MRNQYVIAGPCTEDEALFWNNETGWGSFQTAERFDRSLLTQRDTLPIEWTSVYEVSPDGTIKDRIDPYPDSPLS